MSVKRRLYPTRKVSWALRSIIVIWFTYKKGRPILSKLLEKYNIK